MKNYNQMANDVLQRIGEYNIKQKRKRKVIARVVMPVCCFCFIALLGLGIWQGGWLSNTPEQSAEDALYLGIKDTFDESKGESANNPAANNKIIVNQIEGISADRHNICLLVDDFVEMTRDEMKQYYGVDFEPVVPSDIKAWEDQRSGIYKRDGGTGEVYWDSVILNYSNEDFTRTVHLEIDKGGFPLIDYLHFGSTEEKSIINNIEVMIGKTDNGYYYAEFMYHNVGFVIDAQGVSQDEFVAIITSVLD